MERKSSVRGIRSTGVRRKFPRSMPGMFKEQQEAIVQNIKA